MGFTDTWRDTITGKEGSFTWVFLVPEDTGRGRSWDRSMEAQVVPERGGGLLNIRLHQVYPVHIQLNFEHAGHHRTLPTAKSYQATYTRHFSSCFIIKVAPTGVYGLLLGSAYCKMQPADTRLKEKFLGRKVYATDYLRVIRSLRQH